jgi:hypothetical protein
MPYDISRLFRRSLLPLAKQDTGTTQKKPGQLKQPRFREQKLPRVQCALSKSFKRSLYSDLPAGLQLLHLVVSRSTIKRGLLRALPLSRTNVTLRHDECNSCRDQSTSSARLPSLTRMGSTGVLPGRF